MDLATIKNRLLKVSVLSVICGVIALLFALSFNVIIAFPFGLIGFLLYIASYRRKHNEIKMELKKYEKLNKEIISFKVRPNKTAFIGGVLSLISIICIVLIVGFPFIISFFQQSSLPSNNVVTSFIGAKSPPYIIMEGREVTTVFLKRDGTLRTWKLSVDSYHAEVKRGYLVREFIPDTLLPSMVEQREYYLETCYSYTQLCASVREDCGNCNELIKPWDEKIEEVKKLGIQYIELQKKDGEKIKVIDLRPFVNADAFDKVIPSLYYEIQNDEEFIKEIWHIVTQLTTYSIEIQETPRYPLETITEGGGDCEDTAILVASMLKAMNKDWKVQLVYMDLYNPKEPKEVNHVIVHVDTGTYLTFIETTSKTEMNPYKDGVWGWHFDV